MPRHVDQAYDRIRQSLLRMGGLVEEMIDNAHRALTERDTDLAHRVIQSDRAVDDTEKTVDEACHTILALKQPAAVDLRFLVAVMKITTDLERIGDLAANIARSVRDLNKQPPVPTYGDVGVLFVSARRMVKESLDAFVHRDADLALEVWKRDDEIDEAYRQFFAHLIEASQQDPKHVPPTFQLILIGRSLERIADHATNIAEDVIYFVRGRDIRHAETDYDGDKEANS
ncbi:MAG: phosphate signaling complex protein PhoU [Acidobacteria bacterium]|nr:phosphate signaling complex protein PhoU [Acidobacteriota bacterium]